MKARTEDTGGLRILLSVVAVLFMIGLVIFIFALFGGAFSDTTAVTETGAVVNETLLFTNGTGTDTSVADLKDVQLSNVVVEGCV
jgi:hypothetical protein